jgi:hypothetical protein
MRGWSVRAFDDFEKALAWLSSEGVSENQPARSVMARKLPVRSPKRQPAATALPVTVLKPGIKPPAAPIRELALR